MGFNTSHVVVYRKMGDFLGQGTEVSIHLMLQFITTQKYLHLAYQSFNTSHVVVYRFRNRRIEYLQPSFNTSHVVVYRFFFRQRETGTGVSIHLMLQFILDDAADLFCILKFQYISCCSLSRCTVCRTSNTAKFQYISCCSLSYATRINVETASLFQYISCCSLSLHV